MAEKLSVYDMASKGVNVTSDPLHLADGELTKAQNLQAEAGAVRRRDGMARLNASPMAGSITGLAAMPLPDLSSLTRRFYLPMDDGTNYFRISSDGTTWANSTAVGAMPQRVSKLGTGAEFPEMPLRWAVLSNRLFYPGNDYTSSGSSATPPTIHVWDGANDYVFAQIPLSSLYTPASDYHGVLSIVPYSATQLLVTTYDGNIGDAAGRLFLLDVQTGGVTQLAPESVIAGADGGYLVAVHVYQSWIYLAAFRGNLRAGHIYRIRQGDVTVTLDKTFAAGEGAISMATFLGDLYAGTSAAWPSANAINCHLAKRAASTGAWTNAITGDGVGVGNVIGPLIVSRDGLTMYAFWNSVSGGAAPQIRICSTTTGSSFSTAYDISGGALGATFSNSGSPLVDANGDLYWPVYQGNMTGAVLKRTAAGVWSIVDNALALIRGPLVSITY